MRSKFDKQLQLLNNEMTEMGAMCEEAIALSAKALDTADVNTAKHVTEISNQIDQKERDIESLCMKLLLRQQPVAKDLRLVSSALKMITDMERIGDQSADIAEIITLENICVGDDIIHIREMASATIRMVTDSIEAFVQKDLDTARSVIEHDDVVDGHFDRIKKTLIERFSQPETDGEYALDLLMIAKYFERIGDHATNIAGWVIFSITGKKEN